MNVNMVIVAGNLTRDPELKHLPSGSAVCGFSIAVNERYKSADGERKEVTHFFDCEAWGKTGEAVAQYMSKGKPIFVQGNLKQESWDQDGQRRSRVKIRVESFQFVGGKSDGESKPGEQPNRGKQAAARALTGTSKVEPAIEEQDIPFDSAPVRSRGYR